jgi:plastocyanin
VWHHLRKMSPLSVAIGLLAVAAVGCGGGCGGVEKTRDGAAHAGSSKSGDQQHAEVANQIVIDNFTFDPPTLTIPIGTKVTWVNHDDVPHTATSTAKPKQFDSGTLDTDGKFSHVFTAPGTYEYFCAVHPKMTGQIIVK